jgi:hypothetical protein
MLAENAILFDHEPGGLLLTPIQPAVPRAQFGRGAQRHGQGGERKA